MKYLVVVVASVALLVPSCSGDNTAAAPQGTASGASGASGDGVGGQKTTGGETFVDASSAGNAGAGGESTDPGAGGAAGVGPGSVEPTADANSPVPEAGRAEASVSDAGGALLDAAGPGGGTGTSAGCGTNTARPNAAVQQTMQVAGKTRYYLLYIPSGYSSSTPMPLIFAMHGRGGVNVQVAAPPDSKDWYGRFALKEATAGKAIIAYPQGTGDAPTNSLTFTGTSGWGDEDLPFFDALLADIESKFCVNTKRIFATGYSMGGMFSNTLACQRASVIRAIAPVAGWGPGSAPGSTTPICPTANGKIADMGTHGTKDGTIPYATGQASAEFWRKTNGCGTPTTTSSLYANCVSYPGCPTGREVHFCTHSGDHQVPSFAGANIWKFFNGLPDL